MEEKFSGKDEEEIRLMKILILQNQGFLNSQGGTEKMASFYANNFVKLGHEVLIATNDPKDGKPIFPLDQKVRLVNLFHDGMDTIELEQPYNYKGRNPFRWIYFKAKKKGQKWRNASLMRKRGLKNRDEVFMHNLQRRSKVWKPFFEQEKPDIILSMSIATLLEITYSDAVAIPIINTAHGRPDYDYTDILWYRSEQEMKLLKESYSKLDAVQVFFDNYKTFLPDNFKGLARAIPNPIPQMDDLEIVDHLQTKERYRIVHIGSLINAGKQQELAIQTFSELAEQFPNWNLWFWGEGVDKAYLEERIASLKLKDRVFLAGFTDKPIEKLQEADIFAFPSKYEGFPLSLGEAMSVGLPAVGMQTCSGVNELIQHEKSGFLAADAEEFKSYLSMLMEDRQLRDRLGKEAHEQMKAYKDSLVISQWEDFMDKVVKDYQKT